MTGSETPSPQTEYLGGHPNVLFFVVSGPGGAGKSTLIQRWREADPALGHVKNYTTRPCRPPDEASGIDDRAWYHFVGPAEFATLVRSDFFAQWSHASSGYLSGTPIGPLEEAVRSGTDLVFEYTPQLYMNLRQTFRRHVVGICILPPSLGELRRRLESRQGMTPAVLTLKLAMARQDLAYIAEHDYLIINNMVEDSVAKLQGIRAAEHVRLSNITVPTNIYEQLRSIPRPMMFYYDPYDARLLAIDEEARAQETNDAGAVQ